MNENVLMMLKDFDLLSVCETHLGIRSKCPDGFTLVGRSKEIKSKSPRGGVAVYRNNTCSINIELFYDGFKDCVICKIMNTDVLLISIYIPPSNSIYYDESYFENLDLIYNTFRSHSIIILGDLNSRCGTPIQSKRTYANNPDTVINSNGSKLNRWLCGKELYILNGYKTDTKQFASNFTFFRGKSRSQNDLILSNAIDMVNSLDILERECYSDHTLLLLRINMNPGCSINLIKDCTKGLLSDNH